VRKEEGGRMRKRLTLLVAVAVASLGVAGSAAAFDCIRVSSSLQGLEQSTRSGNWLLFDFSSASAVQETLASIDEEVTAEQAACFATAYGVSGQPVYFALGIGVAGPNGVLALRNGTAAMGDGRGIDHLESSGILPAIFAAAASCGVPVDEEE
jgi:hypothetical protein